MSNNLYPVFAYGKWGAVDRNGNQVIPIVYTSSFFLQNITENRFIVVTKGDEHNNDKYGILDINKCEEVVPAIYDNIQYAGENNWYILKDKMWYIWIDGNLEKIGCYKNVYYINKEYIGVGDGEKSHPDNTKGLNFFYSVAEKRIVSKSEAFFFFDNLASICIDGKYGFINRAHELVIPAIYDYVENFENGFVYAEIGDDNYYVDTQGHQIISRVFKFRNPEYLYYMGYLDDPNCTDDSHDPIYSDEYGGIYMLMEGVFNGLACYKENGLIGLKGLHNRIVTLPIYDFIYLVSDYIGSVNKYICVIKNGKYGVIDREGNTIIEGESKYDIYTLSQAEDLFIISKWHYEGTIGKKIDSLINIKNKQIIPPIYREIRIIEHDLALVVIEKEDKYKYGVLNFFSQEFVIPLIYDECIPYGDLLFVEKEGKWGYIDLQGNEIMKIEQDFDYFIYNNIYYDPYQVEEKEQAWERILNMEPIDFSKASSPQKVHFKDWKPIVKE